jgi:hypothetical protein
MKYILSTFFKKKYLHIKQRVLIPIILSYFLTLNPNKIIFYSRSMINGAKNNPKSNKISLFHFIFIIK